MDERCAWGATTSANWITFMSPIVGLGADTVTFNVEPNMGTNGRAAVILIGGLEFRVKQKGN
jgi:hypothetical protein